MEGPPGRPRSDSLRQAVIGTFAAGVVYLGFFALYTWPWVVHPTTRFFTDTGDGYQNVWNMWWVNHSVTVLHQLPWHTALLHYPYGTSLLGQTMNPFNGLVAVVLLHFLSLTATFNVMVVFSFVATGLFAFWLCRFFGGRFAPAVVGGFVVTFSAYHLAKTLGLMQLVSLEWVPLFILLWWRLLTEPRVRLAVGAAAALLLVVLCDYYYFLFCVVAGLAVLIHLSRRGEVRLNRRSGVVFVAVSTVLTVPLPLALVLANFSDPMQGGHASRSTDALSLVLDGGRWRFASLTRWYWGSIHAGLADSTVYLSLTVAALVAVAAVGRARLGPHTRFWLTFTVGAAVLSLGPGLVVDGTATGIPMPFDLLRIAVPTFEYNVEPARIMVMATLAAGVLVATVLSDLDGTRRRDRLLLGLIFAALVFELWPAPPPLAPIARPPYVAFLSRLPSGGVIDDAAVSHGVVDRSLQLYDQVLDGQPLAFGYLSRTPASVAVKDGELQAVIDAHRYAVLCTHYKFRYYTTPATQPLPGSLPLLYDDGQTIIYRLCSS